MFKMIGLLAQNMLTISNSVSNVIGGTCMTTLTNTSIFVLIMNRIFIQASKIMRKMSTTFGFANYLLLISCFTSKEGYNDYPI